MIFLVTGRSFEVGRWLWKARLVGVACDERVGAVGLFGLLFLVRCEQNQCDGNKTGLGCVMLSETDGIENLPPVVFHLATGGLFLGGVDHGSDGCRD